MSIGLHRKALFWPNASGDFSMIQHRALAISQLQMEQPPTDRLQKKKSCLKVGKSALIPMVVCILSITKIRQENFPNNYIRTKFTLFIFPDYTMGRSSNARKRGSQYFWFALATRMGNQVYTRGNNILCWSQYKDDYVSRSTKIKWPVWGARNLWKVIPLEVDSIPIPMSLQRLAQSYKNSSFTWIHIWRFFHVCYAR